VPIGHELEIVNGFGGIDGIGSDIKNHGLYKVRQMNVNGIGDTTGWDFATSILGIGMFFLSVYGLSVYGKDNGWW